MNTDRIRVKRDEDLPIEFNNTSMTDVIFILLIFFISLSQVRTSSLPIKLPSVSAQASSGFEQGKPLVVEVASDDRITLDGAPVSVEELAARVKARKAMTTEGEEEPRVRIRGDRSAKNGTMMQVVAALAEAGLSKIEFAVKAEAR